MRIPYIMFYQQDWIADPKLTMCSAATRGVWMDMLCAMHMDNRSGVLSGTPEMLAKICRCTVEEMKNAIRELHSTKTADVTFCNNDVTIENRRMKRECNERQHVANRVNKHRKTKCNADVTPPCNGGVTSTRAHSSSISSSSSDSSEASNHSPESVHSERPPAGSVPGPEPTEAEAAKMLADAPLPPACSIDDCKIYLHNIAAGDNLDTMAIAESWFLKMQGQGWRIDGRPIASWRAVLEKYYKTIKRGGGDSYACVWITVCYECGNFTDNCTCPPDGREECWHRAKVPKGLKPAEQLERALEMP